MARVQSDSHTQLKLLSDWRIIGKQYLRGWVWLDLLGSVPTEAVEAIMLATSQTVPFCRSSMMMTHMIMITMLTSSQMVSLSAAAAVAAAAALSAQKVMGASVA